jgi:protein-L-isoaspartate O-methyltransferase
LRPEVEAALRAVPRELFAPGVPVERAYEDAAIITKRRGDETISSVSAPFLIAEMLGQAADALDELAGRHVLEIGSGGYNASLLRELVGASGSVTTVDIDPEVIDRATACLAAAGYDDVRVVCADALWGAKTLSWGSEVGFYAARSYSVISPPRTGLRLIRSWAKSTTDRSERGGRSCSARWGRRPL